MRIIIVVMAEKPASGVTRKNEFVKELRRDMGTASSFFYTESSKLWMVLKNK